jgi:hypothetical protein
MNQGTPMLPQIVFFVSVALSFVAWGIVTAQYIWPKLRSRQRREALRPLLILHSFRFFGMAMLIPGVVSPALPAAFAQQVAYGDLIAMALAMLSLLVLRSGAGVVLVWIFNVWGAADLVNAFYQGNHTGMQAGQMGVAYVIPVLFVPLLMITHGLIFRILLREQK